MGLPGVKFHPTYRGLVHSIYKLVVAHLVHPRNLKANAPQTEHLKRKVVLIVFCCYRVLYNCPSLPNTSIIAFQAYPSTYLYLKLHRDLFRNHPLGDFHGPWIQLCLSARCMAQRNSPKRSWPSPSTSLTLPWWDPIGGISTLPEINSTSPWK